MNTSDFEYELPDEYIAQTPVEPRDASRLLVVDRTTGRFEQSVFRDLGGYLHPGDLLVLNQTRVIPARLFARKLPTGGRVELLLLHRSDVLTWEVLVGGKGLYSSRELQLETPHQSGLELTGEIVAVLEGPRRLVRFNQPLEPYLEFIGNVPLPPYIHTPLSDPERYQTVYARHAGSAAAPTAGLHFTPGLIASLEAQGIKFATVTLHVGLDTFAPVNEANPLKHHIHTEWCQVPRQTVEAVNQVRPAGGRIIAVGTTSVRTLGSAAQSQPAGTVIGEFEGPTSLFILPGYNFRAVDAIITNFHLPRSTLIMLVSAFAGRARILSAYEFAKQENFRFYSFGDAMLIL